MVGSSTGSYLTFAMRNASSTTNALKIKSNGRQPSVQVNYEPLGVIADAWIRVFLESSGGTGVSDSILLLHTDPDTAASNDLGTQIIFSANTAAASTNTEVAAIVCVLDDATDNSKDGTLRFTTVPTCTLSFTGAKFNFYYHHLKLRILANPNSSLFPNSLQENTNLFPGHLTFGSCFLCVCLNIIGHPTCAL